MTDDIQSIVLTAEAIKMIRSVAKGLSAPPHCRACDELLRESLIGRDCTGSNENGFPIYSDSVHITERGLKYLSLRKEREKELRRTKILAIYAAITATIAILIELTRLCLELLTQ